VRIGSGLEGKGHSLSEIHMSFRYVAGYTPSAGQRKAAPVVKLVVLDLKTSKVRGIVSKPLSPSGSELRNIFGRCLRLLGHLRHSGTTATTTSRNTARP
jgi:hypothetical protein